MQKMGQPLQTDSAVLATEASNFVRIASSLQGIMGQVDSTAGSMQMHLQGQSGTAAQAAFVRYQEAAQAQKAALDEISANIHTGGVQYLTTDEDQSAALGQTIPDIGINA
jgi:WXG100 family type VII secretion target